MNYGSLNPICVFQKAVRLQKKRQALFFKINVQEYTNTQGDNRKSRVLQKTGNEQM